ncbi:methylamine utilization protein [Marinobacter confluentis]|uniref:Methylamine utilization protein n=1 Tax=Marinobacter confluentis TaxID=1697557 RepID=A0A4Z1C2S8_9GAMM|nr:methylamine utilization protein [Marinobacter confluentis]TGN39432.1 methylamine utilization protein [Marinobacter confluentis]
MSKNWIVLLLALVPLGLAAEPATLSVQVVDSQTGEPVSGARVIVNHGAAAIPSAEEMIQKNRQFQPQSLLIARGSEVNFPNRDTTQHHVYSFSPARVFNIELYADQPEAPILFDKTGVVEVGCNIHDRMQGFILVTDSALTGQTDDAGNASVALPPDVASLGQLDLSLWHPRLENATRTVDVSIPVPASGPVELTLDLSPAVEESGRLDALQKRFRDL